MALNVYAMVASACDSRPQDLFKLILRAQAMEGQPLLDFSYHWSMTVARLLETTPHWRMVGRRRSSGGLYNFTNLSVLFVYPYGRIFETLVGRGSHHVRQCAERLKNMMFNAYVVQVSCFTVNPGGFRGVHQCSFRIWFTTFFLSFVTRWLSSDLAYGNVLLTQLAPNIPQKEGSFSAQVSPGDLCGLN